MNTFFALPVAQLFSVALLGISGVALYWILLFFVGRLESVLSRTHRGKFRAGRVRTVRRVFTTSGVFVIVMVIGGMILREFQIDPTPILASAGVVGLAISFGAQALIKDVFAGLFVLVESQYDEGDVVKLNEVVGCVEALTLRKVVVKSEDGTIHHVPHGAVQIVSVFPKKV